ncbi:MAG TPA: hypothetical protein VGJ16_11745 [Pirellulales bacterium]
MSLSNLQASERKITSQNGEDGVLEAIFRDIGTTNRYFVEFGVEDAVECNTAHLIEQGWTGLLMDFSGISKNPKAEVKKEFITAENIQQLFEKYRVPHQFDLLSIDIDGNDFWVWKQIEHRPRVIVIEYNAHVPPNLCRVVPYDPTFQWVGTDYFGASVLALKELGMRKGYTLVHCEQTGTNAFFVANEDLPRDYQPRAVEEIYRPPNYLNKGLRWPNDPDRHMVDPFALSDIYFQIDAG